MKPPAKTALVVRHVPFEDLGSLEPILATRGYRVVEADAVTDDLRAAGLLDADLLIVLGGPIGVYEEAAYPFLMREIDLLRQRLEARRPTLGICLGSQLMAKALGGVVHPGANGKEIGWSPVSLTAAGRRGPLRHLEGVPVLHWHGDTFTLPPGTELLASTNKYASQAFAIGRHAMALQFHPEVTAAGLERWFVGHACEIAGTAGISVPQLRSDSMQNAPALTAAAQLCLGEWLDGLN